MPADFIQTIRRLFGRDKAGQAALTEHVMSPYAGATGALSDLEAAYLGINPFEIDQDVQPVASASAAHGYMYVQSRALFDLLDEMADRDTVVGGSLELITAYMLMRPMGLMLSEEDADKPGAKDALDAVQRVLVDGTNWSYMLWSMAEGLLRHGRSTNEIVWHVTPEGYYTPKQFYHCHPGQFTFDRNGEMYIARDGNSAKAVPLAPLKFVTVARPALYDNPWGASLIYPCRFLYHFKKRSMVFRLRYAENHGEPIYHAWVDATTAANPEESRNKLAGALSSIGQNNYIVTSKGEGLAVHGRGGAGGAGSMGGGVHGGIAADYDNYMVTRLLGATLSTRTAENGNRALGEVHERTMLNRILPPSQLLCWAINKYIIDPWCDLNLAPESPRPYWYIDTEESTDAADSRATLETAVKVGLQVAAAEARERLGYREPVEGEEIIGGAGFLPVARQETIAPEDPAAIGEGAEVVEVPKKVAASEDAGPAGICDVWQYVEGLHAKAPVSSEATPPQTFKAPPLPSTPPQEENAATATETHMAAHDYGCVYLRLSEQDAAECDAWARENINVEDLADDGLANNHHITLLYGLTSDDPKPVKQALLGTWPAVAFYGPLRLFQNEGADVLYVEVDADSWGLNELRKELLKGVAYNAEADAGSTGEYTPHITLAYLKPGRGASYVTATDEDGQPTDWPVYGPLAFDIGILDTAVHSTTDSEVQHEHRLTGPYVEMANPPRAHFHRWADQWLQNQERPHIEYDQLKDTPPHLVAAFNQVLARASTTAQTDATLAPFVQAVFGRLNPDQTDYAHLYHAMRTFADYGADVHAAHVAAIELEDAKPTKANWRTEKVQMAELQRQRREQKANEARQERMAGMLHAETRDALFSMVRQTARNIDALWVDDNALLSIRAWNAIDLEPLVQAADHATKISVYGTWLMAAAFTANVKEAALAAKEDRQPKFWQTPPQAQLFAEDEFSFEGWAAAFGDAADWMLSRGVMTIAQVQYIAGIMASQGMGEREEIERQLREQYFALARTVDLNATKKVQQIIANAVGRGETITQFLETIDAKLGIGELPGGLDSYWENVWRTEVANAYSAQQQLQEADPDFQAVLWGYLGGNPNDRRSDPTHAKLAGVYYRNNSPAYQALGRPPFRYRCRCYLTPITDPDPETAEYTESANALDVAAGLTRF